MEFFFYPTDDNRFKEEALNNYVFTVVFDIAEGKVFSSFARKVSKIWEQTCKNNIETDHRIKDLPGNNFQIYSWITKSENDFGLPFFVKK